MKKNVILMLNRVFPVKHKKAGKPTMFANLLYASHKIHTVRVDASGLWEKRVEDFVDYFFGKCGCKSNVFEGVVIHC